MMKNLSLLAVIGFLQHSIGCPFLRSKGESPRDIEKEHRILSGDYTPGVCSKTAGQPAIENYENICSVYNNVKVDFQSLIPETPLGQADLFGKAVRLAFHDAGEVDITNSTDKMGPDGCLSDSSDNAGLVEDDSLVNTVFEPLWQNYCDQISRADFWVLLAKLSLEYADPSKSISLEYQYGRLDTQSCNPDVERLPSPQYGMDELKRVFVNQMGLTIEDAGNYNKNQIVQLKDLMCPSHFDGSAHPRAYSPRQLRLRTERRHGG